jgi:hypothetical protein
MKLSIAIRIGSMTTRQIRELTTDGKNGRCAIGAALTAINAPHIDFCNWASAMRVYFGANLAAISMIYTLNDSYGVSREEIADVVEALENLEARNWEKPTVNKEAVLCH